MTTLSTPESTPQDAPTWVDDEIDLRVYLLVLIAWWREIVGITILVGALAVGGSWFWRNAQPIRYTASADVVIARLTSQVDLDQRIQTTSEAQGSGGAGWRQSLLQLAGSASLAQEVIADLGDRLPESLHEPDAVRKMVETNVPLSDDGRTAADMLSVSATADSPELAALIANVWATRFMSHVNQIYGQIPADTVASVESELTNAKNKYDAAQAALEQYIAGSPSASLQRQIDAKIALRDSLQASRTASLTQIVDEDQRARTALYGALVGVPLNQTLAVIQAEGKGRQDQIAQLYSRLLTVRGQLAQARNLVAQLELGGPAAAVTSAQAFQLLKNQVFAPTASENLTLQAGAPAVVASPEGANGGTPIAPVEPEDAQALVTVLEQSVTQLEADIDVLAAERITDPAYNVFDLVPVDELVDPSASLSVSATTYISALTESYARFFQVGDALDQLPDFNNGMPDEMEQLITQLESQVQTLAAQLAASQSREQELTQQRDLAWTSYDALSNKLSELNLIRTAANSEVRLGSPAIAPSRPDPQPSVRLPIAAVTAATFFAMVLLAFVVNMLGGKPFLARR